MLKVHIGDNFRFMIEPVGKLEFIFGSLIVLGER